ncbi:MAG TPA: hypothetical protein VFE47_15185 [Tepidisphaeraceae bacterium]|jgi:hypothetical protein|nr:hypothetical protein [Tepidisphaeraceae bacterium]
MSLTPGFAADAKSQWLELAVAHQEIVLDIIDRLATNPPSNGEHVADDVHDEQGISHYIFVHVLIERQSNSLTIIGVGHTTRPGN